LHLLFTNNYNWIPLKSRRDFSGSITWYSPFLTIELWYSSINTDPITQLYYIVLLWESTQILKCMKRIQWHLAMLSWCILYGHAYTSTMLFGRSPLLFKLIKNKGNMCYPPSPHFFPCWNQISFSLQISMQTDFWPHRKN